MFVYSQYTVLVGALLGGVTAAWLYLGGNENESYKNYQIYGVSALMGICANYLIIGSMALNSDLIGSNTTSAAFVFASMSFVSKTLNGIVVEILEQFIVGSSGVFYQWIMVGLTGTPAAACVIGMLTLWRTSYGRPHHESP